MALFQNVIVLAAIAVLLLQVSRRLSVPYPTMLALAGTGVAALPWAPNIQLDPQLMLALFVAPALLSAAYDFPVRALRRDWLPLLVLAAGAVCVTAGVVTWLGVAVGGLPVAVAAALGAVVAPPEALAAGSIIRRSRVPGRTIAVVEGESLLNDAVALLIYSIAIHAVPTTASHLGSLSSLAFAAPGGAVLGYVLCRIYIPIHRLVAGTLSETIFEFVCTFSVWIIAEWMHLSAILTVVVFAMTLARRLPTEQSASERVQSYAVWEAAVFLLNVLAFLLIGLQSRAIVFRLSTDQLWHDLRFAGAVLATVIVIRVIWVLLYNRVLNIVFSMLKRSGAPSLSQALVVSWCGMRGVITLATALALPEGMPSRDLVVLCAFTVVLGTLVLQGLTLGPLISVLRFAPDKMFGSQLAHARVKLADAALAQLEGRNDETAIKQREIYLVDRAIAEQGQDPVAVGEIGRIRREAIKAKRIELAQMRRTGEIDEEVFAVLLRELDWAELAVALPSDRDIEEI